MEAKIRCKVMRDSIKFFWLEWIKAFVHKKKV